MGPSLQIEPLLSRLKIDGYEIFTLRQKSLVIEAKGGEVESSHISEERGVAVQLFYGERAGFACSSEFSEPFLERMFKN